MAASERPWAILLCRFSDDANDPARTLISSLYSQWLTSFGASWLANNLTLDAASDSRTILDLYNAFFTTAGAGTYNSVKFWGEMSHGSIDVSGSRVFPCRLDMTKAEGAALAQTPGGKAYQDAMFGRAKAALRAQYGVDWTNFFAVAVSFQSPDYGNQGGRFDTGTNMGPGVYSDIRFVRSWGMASWGQEMGHAFGLDHSKLNGSTAEYGDPWDVMSTRSAFCFTPDANYGLRGVGLNAWNMRSRQWLDESRIWKPTALQDFSKSLTIRPLHRRDLPGYLGAELPGIGTDSSYLVEFRVRDGWDTNIPEPVVLVHRFVGPIGQFLGTYSYLMQGSRGQAGLAARESFEAGNGPWVTVAVQSIDEASGTAQVQLCYSQARRIEPTVKVRIVDADTFCRIPPAEGSVVTATFDLLNPPCGQAYRILWSVDGVLAASAGMSADPEAHYLHFTAPDHSVETTIRLSIYFDDGSIVSTSLPFQAISQAEAGWLIFLCNLQNERMKPIPWWEWDPEKLTDIAKIYSRGELRVLAQRAEQVAQTLNKIGSARQLKGGGRTRS